MTWVKKGLIFNTLSNQAWNVSHAQVPTTIKLNSNTWRIFYSTRNKDNQSSISFFDVAAGNPKKIVYTHGQPILSSGELGSFDDSGVMPSSIVYHKKKFFLYYTGWTKRVTVPYSNGIGLAISSDCLTFEKYSKGPIFYPHLDDPFFIGTASVCLQNNEWECWYASCTGWERFGDQVEPLYHLKYAYSKNGINWERPNITAIDYSNENEGGIVRAAFNQNESPKKIWFSARGKNDYRKNIANSYRIYSATQNSKHTWVRSSTPDIDVSQNGWDSEMVAYPNIIEHEGVLYMFYNGNGFGASGIGYATQNLDNLCQ